LPLRRPPNVAAGEDGYIPKSPELVDKKMVFLGNKSARPRVVVIGRRVISVDREMPDPRPGASPHPLADERRRET